MTRRSPGDGSLYKRKADGLWVGSVSITGPDGKRRRKQVSHKNRNQCIAKLRELRKLIDAGQLPTAPSTTVERWLTHWLETIAKPHIRPMTYRSYEQSVRLHITPAIGAKRLDKLTAEDVRTMYVQIQATSPRFAQLSHQILSKSLRQATIEGLLSRNPMAAVTAPKYTPTQRQAFSADIAARIIATQDELQTLWATAFLTGMRRGELIGLCWDQVNLDDGYLEVSRQLQRLPAGYSPPPGVEAIHCTDNLWWTRPKTRSGYRIVPLLPPLVSALCALKYQNDTNPHNLVWHRGGEPITPEQLAKAWRELLKKACLPHAPFHAVRHSTATLLHAAGVDESTRMLILGHSSAVATRGYLHIDRARLRSAMAGLAELMPRNEKIPPT